MNLLHILLTRSIQLHTYILVLIAITYILIHHYRYKPVIKTLDIYLNYIPVLTHEFGHILFNKISGGRAKDLVIIVSSKERERSLQQGYAITSSSSRLCQISTTLGGYVMPPIMLLVGLVTVTHHFPSLFIIIYIFIFLYYLILTSRKTAPLVTLFILIGLLYVIFKYQYDFFQINLISLAIHFILGVLFGEVIQSSYTILRLTFSRQPIDWDGAALRELTHIPIIFFTLIWLAINSYSLYVIYLYIV
ncbi:M50 family metallopeptidase [Staphylococcus sp. SQ8-PEA]|uniref:M50 family metallopeptidase n=1 Tax=Staphylococcus marylandisciuri TaxID=2981529 RepID=A0ABT2QSE6_9STAP|nr:M50 family metallopeptidase [Staphylococcus marylandisciuri]MCU5746909.1 M50 family metallopeptidase [Staphylococcus marylandisciuri]